MLKSAYYHNNVQYMGNGIIYAGYTLNHTLINIQRYCALRVIADINKTSVNNNTGIISQNTLPNYSK
jgi:hypothetical protein